MRCDASAEPAAIDRGENDGGVSTYDGEQVTCCEGIKNQQGRPKKGQRKIMMQMRQVE